VTFDGTRSDNDSVLFIDDPGNCLVKFDRGEMWRFWVVDVGGTPVTIVFFSPATEFDLLAAEAQAMVDSIDFRDFG
jgi:hypothetical protein